MPYSVAALAQQGLTTLPDTRAEADLVDAARAFWDVPEGAEVLAAPGASALIAQIPGLVPPSTVHIPGPTYNEHAAAFEAFGWKVGRAGKARVIVNPNNPDGRFWEDTESAGADLLVIDESFCDVRPEGSLIRLAGRPGVLVLKSFGKFWGLPGLRLGFAIGDPDLVGRLGTRLGPWPVSGPALAIGLAALEDRGWAEAMRANLEMQAARLDKVLEKAGMDIKGGTSLFRLADCGDAVGVFERLANSQILTRVFPYSKRWIRFGLPGDEAAWHRLEAAL